MPAELFPIAPVLDKARWFSIGFGVFCVAMILFVSGAMVFAWKSVTGLRQASFVLEDDGLRLRCFPYSRVYGYGQLDLDHAAVVDFQSRPDLAPVRRTAGTALGALKGGWYRLKNGQKAMLCLTGAQGVVVIPTRTGHMLLLNPTDPQHFLARLRARAAG